jgi:pimeloyl-ACP methyl ester carboxylesterase
LAVADILQAGIAAVKSGDRERAAALFAQVVKVDPSSEEGWYWLGLCFTEPERREYCFRRVLTLNPDHNKARQQLDRLSAPTPPEAPAPPLPVTPPFRETAQPAPDWSASPAEAEQKPVTPFEPRVSPFVDAPAVTEGQKPPTPVVSPAAFEVENPKPKEVPQKKPKRSPVLLLGSLGVLFVCCSATGYLFLSGRMSAWIPPEIAALLTPVHIPTQMPLPTLASVTASPTPNQPGALPSPRPTVSYTASFEEAPCPPGTPGNTKVTCGFLIVPEDRAGDPTHTIRLAVAVFHSYSQNPAPDPVLFLQGGPGGEAVQLSIGAFDFLVDPFLEKRDFIAYDQRGTGLSEPALNCDELTKAYLNDIHGLTPLDTREIVYSNAFLSCSGLMSAQGIQLDAYTTAESAADVRDLVAALGYEKINLYGASYGTRLAQVIMRDHPEIVNTSILDSVVPVEGSLFSQYPNSIQSGLRTLFIDCAIDPACNAAYPNLESVFWELVSELDANPQTITTSGYPTGTITETVTGSTVMSIILGSIKNSGFISTAPQSIYRFKNGDFSTLILAQSSLPFTFEGINTGLFISVMCHEHVLSIPPEELQNAAAQQIIKEYAWLPFYGDSEDVLRTCKSWGAAGPSLGENDPVVSDIPSLIITGAYDPTTPPLYGRQIADGLSRHYYFEFPTLGHTPTAADGTGCAMGTVLEFLDNPAAEPDRSCLDNLEEIEFIVPYTGDPALALRTAQVDGISVRVPRDWFSLGGGFYFRGNSVFDITEAGILRVPSSSDELERWFNLEAYGYRGLDSPLLEAGKRQANGLTWTLYTSSSYGRPVDFAMADDQGSTVVIALFSNSDEHEALHRTVYLPMIDSAQP